MSSRASSYPLLQAKYSRKNAVNRTCRQTSIIVTIILHLLVQFVRLAQLSPNQLGNAQSTQYDDFMPASEFGMTGLHVTLFDESVAKDNPSAIYVLKKSALTICHNCSPLRFTIGK